MSDFKIDLFDYAIKPGRPDASAANANTKKKIFSPRLDGTKSFESLMSESLTGVNDLQMDSDKLITKLATGDVDDISEVVMASSRAEVAMRMLMEVRNKLLEAYQQISRIQG